MGSQRLDEVRRLFLKARGVPPEGRSALLAEECGDDAGLMKEVEELLATDGEEVDLSAVTEVKSGRGAAPAEIHRDPEQVGQYRILGKIGEGGMGVVYRAEQREPVRRVVALKLIKLGMDSREVVARFEAERQALALMNHPNVAKVLEAGVTEAGRPYFAMELVQGIDFVRYCEDEKLTVRQRIGLFIPVCQAVQHAHQKGIIHRDLKPGNILVQLIDGKAVPKVIDFGIAKATNQVLTQHTLFTQTGAMIGTPEYMSPEQAMTSGLDVDTRTDIYSLGVILYQVLTGTLPLDPKALREAGLEGMAKLIKNVEPQRPSTRLLKAGATGDGAMTALTRNTKLLHKELQEDLDWIVLKAMEKDRARRYETASALAIDLQRHLDGETVLARPPSTLYRVQKFVGKHKGPVIAGTAVVMCLVIALVSLGVLFAVERNYARNERTRSQELTNKNDELKSKTDQANRANAEAQTEKQLADASAAEAKSRLMDVRVAQADALALANRVEEARKEYLKAIDDSGGYVPASFSAQVGLDLADLKSPPPLLRLEGHSDTVFGVAWSADGWYLFSGSRDRSVRRWDLLGGSVTKLDGKFDVKSVACGGGSGAVAAFDSSGAVRLCDFENGQESAPMPWGEAGRVVALSADGRLALVPRDDTYEVWDLRNGRRIGEAPHKQANVRYAAIASNGAGIIFGTDTNEAQYWELGGTQPLWRIAMGEAVQCVAVSPDGRFAIIASGENRLQVLDVAKGTLTRSLQGHRAGINCVAFSPDGELAISGSSDHTVRLWDWREGNEICCFHGHGEAVNAVAFSPDGKTAASAGADNVVMVWPIPGHTEFFDEPDHISNVAISADGRMALAGTNQGTAKLWDVPTGCLLATLDGDGSPIKLVGLAGNGAVAVGAGMGKRLYVWNVTKKLPPRVLIDDANIQSLAVSADGHLALCGHKDGVTLWNLAGGTKLTIGNHDGTARAVAFGDDGKLAISAGLNLVVHDLNGPVVTSRIIGSNDSLVESIALSPDGTRALSGDEDGWVRVWNVADGKSLALGRHTYNVTGVGFGPDGRTAFSGQDRTLRMWDVDRVAEVRVVAEGIEAIDGIALAGNRMTLASTGKVESEKHRIRTWDLGRAKCRAESEGKVMAALKKLADGTSDAASLGALGEWYAFEGKYEWAVAVLKRAREQGYALDPELLGECYWAMSRQETGSARAECLAGAQREFQRALGAKDSLYLRLCAAAVEEAVGVTK